MSGKLRLVDAEEVIKVLKRVGFEVRRLFFLRINLYLYSMYSVALPILNPVESDITILLLTLHIPSRIL